MFKWTDSNGKTGKLFSVQKGTQLPLYTSDHLTGSIEEMVVVVGHPLKGLIPRC